MSKPIPEGYQSITPMCVVKDPTPQEIEQGAKEMLAAMAAAPLRHHEK